MSAAGVALATILSQYLSAALVLWCLMKDDGPLHVDLKQLCLDGSAILRMMKLGLPAGFQGALFALSNVVIQSTVNSFGSIVVAACSAAGNIEGFVWVAMNSFTQTALTFVSQNYGAGRPDRVKKGLYTSYALVSFMGLAITALILIFRVPLLSLYGVVEGAEGTADAVAFYTGTVRVYYILIPYFLCGLMEVGTSSVRALGRAGLASIISLFGACIFRVFWVAVVFPRFYTLESLLVSYPISWITTALIAYVFAMILNKNFKKKLELSSAS
jgi:Na+-driven multidrug efflux pump